MTQENQINEEVETPESKSSVERSESAVDGRTDGPSDPHKSRGRFEEENTSSVDVRWEYTNDLLAGILVLVYGAFNYLQVKPDLWLSLAFMTAVVWAFGTSAFKQVQKLRK